MKNYYSTSTHNIYSTYFQDNNTSYLVSQSKLYNKEHDNLSFLSYDLGLATMNFDLSYINTLKKFKDNLDNNLLVVSMLDDKMYYDKNCEKSSYQYNNLLFINNEKDIIPLSLNIDNIESALTINNGEIQVKIDDYSIKDYNSYLETNFDTIRLANSNDKGIFKVDNESLMLEDNKVTLSYTIADIVDNIDDHINIMNSVISQSESNLEKVKVVFKEYPLYDKKYSCNIDTNANLYYSDQKINNDIMKNNFHYIDYNQKYFKIKIKFLYNYISSSISGYNPFNEKYLNISIQSDNTDSTINSIEENINTYIKFNINKSYIFNSGITNFDSNTNNVFGEINYFCYFNIDNEAIYNELKKINKRNGSNPFNSCRFNIKINYNDKFTNIESSVECQLDLFIDTNFDKISLHKIIYHDYSVGFNFDGIGKQLGMCMIPNGNNVNNTPTYPKPNKPIFFKYFFNENNYTINYVSKDIFTSSDFSLLSDIILNNPNNFKNNVSQIGSPKLYGNEDNSIGNMVLYKNLDIDNVNSNLGNIPYYFCLDGKYVNRLYNTNNIYKDCLKYCFNDTYNEHGNGLRKGDLYVPCLAELVLFYKYGFYYYISYIYDEVFNNMGNIELDSSTLYKPTNSNNIEIYSLSFDKELSNATIIRKQLGKIKIGYNGQIYKEGENNSIITHTSISCFKIPDYSILFGNYYINFDEEENYEIIEYSTKNNIEINIQCYNNNPNILNFLIVPDDNVKYSNLSITKSENHYVLKFTINNYKDLYNEFMIYYIDSDNSFNRETVKYNNITNNYRILCKLGVKIQ